MKKMLCVSIFLLSHNIGADSLWDGRTDIDYEKREYYSERIHTYTKPTSKCLLGQDCRWSPLQSRTTVQSTRIHAPKRLFIEK